MDTHWGNNSRAPALVFLSGVAWGGVRCMRQLPLQGLVVVCVWSFNDNDAHPSTPTMCVWLLLVNAAQPLLLSWTLRSTSTSNRSETVCGVQAGAQR